MIYCRKLLEVEESLVITLSTEKRGCQCTGPFGETRGNAELLSVWIKALYPGEDHRLSVSSLAYVRSLSLRVLTCFLGLFPLYSVTLMAGTYLPVSDLLFVKPPIIG